MPPPRHHSSRTHCQAGMPLSPAIDFSCYNNCLESHLADLMAGPCCCLRGLRSILRPSQTGPVSGEGRSLVWGCRAEAAIRVGLVARV